MHLYFSGGAMEIGGSCIYIRLSGRKLLLDCGIRQSAAKDPLPDFRTIQEQGGVDAILISHAHMDHIGALPIISRAYPDAPIYMTLMTADLTRVLLYDSLKIMNSREDEIPHYSEQDVLAMLGRIHPIHYHMPFSIFDDFTLTFYPAGHIAGAACVYLVTEEGSLFYSGDFSAFSQRTIEGIRIPKLRPDVAIVETTYGNRLHSNRQIEENRLIELVRECILEKKKILIPAFALGRAQEVLLILRTAIQNQQIPAVPVYTDGMVRDINTMYTRNPTFLKHALGRRILKGNEPFYTKEIQPVTPVQGRNREELLSGSEPVILLSSSGMLTGGPSAQYARLLAPREDACIIITGYQDEESPGRQLLNLLNHPEEKSLVLNGNKIPVRCRIEQVGLSAHGDRTEILSLLERLSSRRIFLVHGNPDAMEDLGKELAAGDCRRQVYLPACGQGYELTLHGKRKQLSFQPPDTMQMNRAFSSADEKLLWDYWQAHYPGKAFSLAQIAHIWYGRPVQELPKHMQEIFLHSAWFSPNPRRLFLFEPNPPEAVAQALAPKEWTIQELETRVQALFSEYPYRKISCHRERRELLLQFDYPDSQDPEKFQKTSEAFTSDTGWSIRIGPSMNHNAALLLLSSLFGSRLLKTSYYPERKCYSVSLPAKNAPSASDQEAAELFRTTTGWTLHIHGRTSSADSPIPSAESSDSSPEDFFVPSGRTAEPAEQNLALFCIDQTFESLPHRPDKKSLKNDSSGKYLELAFLSPAIGRRYAQTLQTLSSQIGWRIRISEKINQMELMKAAQLLCRKAGITLIKNPSWMPQEQIVQLKIQAPDQPEKLREVEEAFQEQTGCACRFLC